MMFVVFFFKQKTAYEMRISDWSSDVCSSDLLFAERFGADLDAVRGQAVFAGDSPNDAPMFGYFPYSVGVANVRPFLDRIAARPAFVTAGEGGPGFVELAEALLAVRQ